MATRNVIRNATATHGAGFQVRPVPRRLRSVTIPSLSGPKKSRKPQTLGAGCQVRFAPRPSASKRNPSLPFEEAVNLFPRIYILQAR